MLPDYLLFLAKIATFIIAILLLFVGIIAIASKGKDKSKEKLDIKKINEKLEETTQTLREAVLTKDKLKEILKTEKKQQKAADKAQKEGTESRKRIFVLNFQGDIRASAVKNLREEITAILTIATPEDEVVICLESPGGMVHAYGLAASQLKRIRAKNIPLTAIVDKVAASGGYMMACVANRILAAPFAVLGSIGVIAQLPNFHRLLKKNDVDFEQIMAGQYKRTLTIFGENTKEGRKKFQEEVDETQELFKAFVIENRPSLNIDHVATGEHWFGTRALELNLIDDIMTSDDYILAASQEADIFEITHTIKKNLMEKFSTNAQKAFDTLVKRT